MLPDAAVPVHDDTGKVNIGLLRTHRNAKTRRANRLERELAQTRSEIAALEGLIETIEAQR
jgi:hypothetical protein